MPWASPIQPLSLPNKSPNESRMKKLLLLFMASIFSAGVFAQSFEIRAVNKGGGIVGVEIRLANGSSLTTADNLFTDITFGIKWAKSYGVDLRANLTTDYRIKKAGERQEKGNFHYQSFYADPTPFAIPVTFDAGQWKEILAVDNTRFGTVPTGTFQIVEPNFDPATDPNLGIGYLSTGTISYFSPAINGSATDVILPVKLIRFEVLPVNKTIQVQWTTAGEYNNKGFDIERSEAPTSGFKKIAWLDSKGAGGNPQHYGFEDSNVANKIHYYYRLKQFDRNGNYQYSETRMAMMSASGNNALQMKPNPVQHSLQIILGNGIEKATVQLKVVDARGAVVIRRNINSEPGKTIDVDVSAMPQGQYFLMIENKSRVVASAAFQKL